MAMTPEQAKKLGEARIKSKQHRIQKERDAGEKKKTHDWYSEFVYTGMLGHLYKNAGHWCVSHCKKCGLPYLTFKAMPQSCQDVLIKQGKMGDCSGGTEEQCAPAPATSVNIKG